jgi:hypothetical protein
MSTAKRHDVAPLTVGAYERSDFEYDCRIVLSSKHSLLTQVWLSPPALAWWKRICIDHGLLRISSHWQCMHLLCQMHSQKYRQMVGKIACFLVHGIFRGGGLPE